NSAQTKPTDAAGIGSPANTSQRDVQASMASSGGAPQLGDTGADSGKPLNSDQRQQTVDAAVKDLASKGLLGKHELVFDNKFAAVDRNSNGTLDMSSLQKFRTYADAEKDARIHGDEALLNGNTVLGSNLSTIYAGAAMSAIVKTPGGPLPLDPQMHAEFVIMHEFAHGNGIRDEDAADQDALQKLGLWH